MDNLIRVYENVISDTDCDKLIERFEDNRQLYQNFDDISCISFLPYSEHVYRQAPYQDCTEEEYDEALSKMPKDVDWALLSKYESQDYTVASQELACTGNSCEII